MIYPQSETNFKRNPTVDNRPTRNYRQSFYRGYRFMLESRVVWRYIGYCDILLTTIKIHSRTETSKNGAI